MKFRKDWRRIGFSLVVGGLCAAGVFAQSPEGREREFESLLKSGFALHQQARFSEAIPILERARALEPDDYFANLLLGIDRLRSGDPQTAIPMLRAAARIRPNEGTPEGYLGEAEDRLGNYASAALAYQEAVRREPGSEEAQEAWAGFALERFRTLGARLRATDAGIVAIHQLQDAARSGKPLRCAAPIDGLERKVVDPGGRRGQSASSIEAARALSVCYSLAAGDVSKQLEVSGKDAAALSRLRGDVLLLLKEDPKAALAEYRRALATRPDDPGLLQRLAEAQLVSGDAESAQQSAKAALAIDGHQREAMRTLAVIAMNDREYEQALPWLKQLAQESPGDMAVQVELGRALAQTGQAELAFHYLATALDAGYPDEKGALHALEARVLRQLGRDHEADLASAEARRRSDAFQASNKEGGRETSRAPQ